MKTGKGVEIKENKLKKEWGREELKGKGMEYE